MHVIHLREVPRWGGPDVRRKNAEYTCGAHASLLADAERTFAFSTPTKHTAQGRRVLDVGCGTGENAIFFAERGHQVTGLDFLEQPLQIARQKAADRGVDVEFIQHDALRLDELDRPFDNVLDSGLFHGLSDEDRIRYVAAIGKVLKPDGKLYMQCFSDQEPAGEGPRRVSETEIREVFSGNWRIVSITPTRFVVRSDANLNFSDGGPKASFCVVKRVY